MSKHTPGPWYPDFFEGISIFHDIKDRRFPICRIEPISDGEAEANARLIAAAPELLEGLKLFRRTMSILSDFRSTLPPEQALQCSAIAERLDSLIAKAEGKQ